MRTPLGVICRRAGAETPRRRAPGGWCRARRRGASAVGPLRIDVNQDPAFALAAAAAPAPGSGRLCWSTWMNSAAPACVSPTWMRPSTISPGARSRNDRFVLVEVAELEGLEVADEEVARPVALWERIEVLERLVLGSREVPSCALLLDEQDPHRATAEASKSVGSNGETVLRLKAEQAFGVGVWTFDRRCRLR